MKILVIDGQGGSLGRTIICRLLDEKVKADIIAVGTNSAATQNMIKGNGIPGATGENPVVVNARDADVIIGPMGIIAIDSMLGEITEKMVVAITKTKALKLLIPYDKCRLIVAGVKEDSFGAYIDDVIRQIKKIV